MNRCKICDLYTLPQALTYIYVLTNFDIMVFLAFVLNDIEYWWTLEKKIKESYIALNKRILCQMELQVQ